MANANNQTQLTGASVEKFLGSVADEQQRADSFLVSELMQEITGKPPKMWGPAIVGFGLRHLKYDSGREVDCPEIAFSPRKGNITLYVLSKSLDQSDLLGKIGKHKASGGCLHIKKLADVDEKILEKLIRGYHAFIKKGGA